MNGKTTKEKISWKDVVKYGLLIGGVYCLAALFKKSARLEGENRALKEIVNDLENDNKKLVWSQYRLQKQLKDRLGS